MLRLKIRFELTFLIQNKINRRNKQPQTNAIGAHQKRKAYLLSDICHIFVAEIHRMK